MQDSTLVRDLSEKCKLASQKVATAFHGLSNNELNWKPSEKEWSIAQCLEHLIISNTTYFETFDRIASGKYEMTRWEMWSPLSGFFGKVLMDQMQEKVTRKMTTPKVFRPRMSRVDGDIINRYNANLDKLLFYVNAFRNVDLDKTLISSPSVKFITYSLRHCLTFLATHQHRHIGQAMRMKDRMAAAAKVNGL